MSPRLPAGGFAKDIIEWQRRHGRRNFPWQSDPTPYRVWVSEVMLQQTRASVAELYYQRFIDRFPDVDSLAAAGTDDVLALWSGLGYYARARSLHACARIVADEMEGAFPDTLDGLVSLPGIGRSTAGAILSLAFGKPHAVLDGNVARVLARIYAVEEPLRASAARNRMWELAESLLPRRNAAEYAQGMMDLGALICRARKPLCGKCPARRRCTAYEMGAVDRIPVKSRGLKKKEATFLFALILCKRHVLLVRRPEDSFWGGLLAPPIFDTARECRGFADRFRGQPPFRSVEPFTAVFSHMRIRFRPCLAETDRRLRMKGAKWTSLDSLDKTSLPSPVRRMLQAMAKANPGEPGSTQTGKRSHG